MSLGLRVEMNSLRITLYLFFCFLPLVVNCQQNTEPKANLDNNKTVLEYCESFALKYAESNSYIYQEKSVSVKRKNSAERVLNKISNFVSPRDSRFTDGYDCLFQIKDDRGDFYNISVGLFLATSYEFAEYTIEGQSKAGYIIPIEYIRSATTKKEGYGVFKFLKKTKSLM